MRFIRSLKFQIAVALACMIALFVFFGFHTLHSLDLQRTQGALLRLAGELQATAQHMAMQAMNYEKNSPEDSASYARDLRLYYQDLMHNTEEFDAICKAFSSGHFENQLEHHEPMNPVLGEHTKRAAKTLERQWKDFLGKMQQTIGSEHMPRLSEAAHLIVRLHPQLMHSTQALLEALDKDIQQQARESLIVVRASFGIALTIALGILWWFFVRVLRPLSYAAEGFRQASAGNFTYQIPVDGSSEIDLLAIAYNRLAKRLDSLFELTTHLQEGSDLDETLAFVSTRFPKLLPLDWVGVLFIYNQDQIQLERAYSDGQPEDIANLQFSLQGTLLKQCLKQGKPLHIPDIQAVAQTNPAYQFLHVLTEKQRRDAIFLPVTQQSPVPGVLVFATRSAHAYQPEHLELLSNLATVITLSFGKTIKLAEHARLAAIGQFATSIAHEIRTPLATVSMALDYFFGMKLPGSASKRLDLAEAELQRMSRLLEDMLLYAKPLRLKLTPTRLCSLIESVIDSQTEAAANKNLSIALNCCDPTLEVLADSDRMTQVLLNILQNAVEAAPRGSQIKIVIKPSSSRHQVRIAVRNKGHIEQKNMKRLFEPFFTTKNRGTGLGLAIVKRLTEAQGGNIHVTQTSSQEVIFELVLPVPPESPALNA